MAESMSKSIADTLTGEYWPKRFKAARLAREAAKAASVAEIEKAGEGSRGGKIIGHTSSGKPIYAGTHGVYDMGKPEFARGTKFYTSKENDEAVANHFAGHRATKNYAAQDHDEAAAAHEGIVEKQKGDRNVYAATSSRAARAHRNAANAIRAGARIHKETK